MQRAWHPAGRLVGALTITLASVGLSLAAPQPQSPASEAVRPEDGKPLRQLVSQLDADTLQARQQASDELLAAGLGAIDPLMEALPGASAETTLRGLAILKKLMQSTDAETKHKARGALERLARSDEPSLASQARSILKAQDPLARSAVRTPGQVGGIPGGFQMIQMQMVNGPATRRIVAHENGQTVVIAESPTKGITVTVSQRVDGKDQTTTVVAASREDLDQKSPRAAALYRKYMAGGNLGFPGGNPLLVPGMVIPPDPFRRFEKPRLVPPVQKP